MRHSCEFLSGSTGGPYKGGTTAVNLVLLVPDAETAAELVQVIALAKSLEITPSGTIVLLNVAGEDAL